MSELVLPWQLSLPVIAVVVAVAASVDVDDVMTITVALVLLLMLPLLVLSSGARSFASVPCDFTLPLIVLFLQWCSGASIVECYKGQS